LAVGERTKVLALRGDLSEEETRKLDEKIASFLRMGRKHVVLDLTCVWHADYRAIPVLAARAREAKQLGGGITLVGVSKYLREILTFSGEGEAFDLPARPGRRVAVAPM
jgi:anti-anti-sigma factor